MSYGIIQWNKCHHSIILSSIIIQYLWHMSHYFCNICQLPCYLYDIFYNSHGMYHYSICHMSHYFCNNDTYFDLYDSFHFSCYLCPFFDSRSATEALRLFRASRSLFPTTLHILQKTELALLYIYCVYHCHLHWWPTFWPSFVDFSLTELLFMVKVFQDPNEDFHKPLGFVPISCYLYGYVCFLFGFHRTCNLHNLSSTPHLEAIDFLSSVTSMSPKYKSEWRDLAFEPI